MRTKRTRNSIREISEKYNISINQTEEIVESFFRFTAEVMKEGNPKTMDFAQIRLMKWGIFKVKEGRKRFFERLNNEKLNRNKKQRSNTVTGSDDG